MKNLYPWKLVLHALKAAKIIMVIQAALAVDRSFCLFYIATVFHLETTKNIIVLETICLKW